MRSNPLQAFHEQAEATFLPYGPDLAIVESYGEVEAEYAAVRKAVALMDDPHRSVIVLAGKDRLPFLQSLITNDTRKLLPGQGQYAYLLNTKGRIVMDLNVLQMEDATLLEVDARLTGQLVKELEKYLFSEDVKILDASEQLGRLTLLGKNAARLLAKVADAGIETLDAAFRNAKRTINKTTVTVFRNDVAGEPQYELIVPRDQLVRMWEILHEAGSNGHADGEHTEGDTGINLRAIGWSAFNIARIEAGTPLLGIDITDQNLPMETAHWYLRAVAVDKGCYLGQEIVARMHAHNSVARLIVGLKIDGDQVPIAGTEILDGNTQIGMVTSSTMSPMLGHVPVALAYVRRAAANAGSVAEVPVDHNRAKATVVNVPFWNKP